MYKFIGYVLIIASLLLCCVRMQACANSSTQATIEFTEIKNGSNSVSMVLYDVLADTNNNTYLIYSNSTFDYWHMTKRNSSGDYEWSVQFSNFTLYAKSQSAVLSSDGNTIRIMGQRNPGTWLYVQVDTCKYDSRIFHTLLSITYIFSWRKFNCCLSV